MPIRVGPKYGGILPDLSRAFRADGSGGGPAAAPICPIFPKDKALGLKGTYQLYKLFAQGGMSNIYSVVDPQNNWRLLKVIMDFSALSPTDQAELKQRFNREIDILNRIGQTQYPQCPKGQLGHPNIVRLIDRDPLSQPRYFIMECIFGGSLAALIESGQRVPCLDAVKIISKTLNGLIGFGQAVSAGKGASDYAHRDLKPDNILWEKVTVDGKEEYMVKVVDFGIARTPESELTVTGQTLGTPEYSAPELLPNNPKAASQCTDNYALGVILYELLTGKVAFNFRNAQGGMNAEIVSAFLANPMEAILDFRLRLQEEEAIPQEVRDLVFKAMDPEPQARFQAFVEFKRSSDSLLSRFINT